MSGNPGVAKTMYLVGRQLYWPGMWSNVADYVRHCELCQHNKASVLQMAGELQPLSISGKGWKSVSMNLIMKLPRSARGYDAILVFVDRLTKMVRLVPSTESTGAAEFAQMFVEHVVRLHGVPEHVESDRGAQFNGVFLASVCNLLGLNQAMSSIYHPKSNGQTERTNRVVEEMLRTCVRPDQRDWDQVLWCAEFAINNSYMEAKLDTLFFLNYGQHPLIPASLNLPRCVPQTQDFTKGIAKAIQEAEE
eukprot:1147447-Pelagomonas_calceolata.AAC.13